jgi:hypothetical protein
MEKRSRYFLRFTTGGYNGSAHTLACELDKDTLTGVYYQAVAKQKFDIFFRARE